MRQKEIYFYTAAASAIIIPVPGRLAFGIVMVLLFIMQMMLGLLFAQLISMLKLEDLRNVLLSVGLIASTIFFKQILIVFCPIIALTLGFLIYLPALSNAIIEFCYRDDTLPFYDNLIEKTIRWGTFSGIALCFFLFRDIVGYGTITFPGSYNLIAINLPLLSHSASAGTFFATIPGAFVLVAVVLSLYLFVTRQIRNVRRAEGGVEK